MITEEPLHPESMPGWLQSLQLPHPPYVISSINEDDCAVLGLKDEIVIVTTDFLNAKPMVLELGLGSNWDVGRLVVAANLADLCGSGATPRALLAGIRLPMGSQNNDAQQVMRGIAYEADRWNVPLVGGDTKLGSPSFFAVAVGSAPDRAHLFLKNGAKTGDIVWVSGDLGSCAAAVTGIGAGLMDSQWYDWARAAIVEPSLPVVKSQQVSQARIGHGGTDISDGLGADLAALCEASHVGVVVDSKKIPVSPAACALARTMNYPSYSFAFGIGGDFQFIVTTGSEHMERMQECGFSAIGQITEDPSLWLEVPSGEKRPLPVEGHTDARGLTFAEEMITLLEPQVGESPPE